MPAVRATLAEVWEGLERCRETHDSRLLERHREAARRHLGAAIDRAISRVGLTPLAELMDEVDFSGWRPGH